LCWTGGYHPLLATRARNKGRRGGRDPRPRRHRLLEQADTGFWNKEITARLRAKGCLYWIGVRVTSTADPSSPVQDGGSRLREPPYLVVF
jgi:hypothetical protein